jgi:hypothetical protein
MFFASLNRSDRRLHDGGPLAVRVHEDAHIIAPGGRRFFTKTCGSHDLRAHLDHLEWFVRDAT